MVMVELYAPLAFHDMTDDERSTCCNGCGAAGKGYLVPDSMYGLSVTEPCNIHDWQYAHGSTIADKEEADRVFLNNCLRLINDSSKWLRWLRRRRALKYYWVVKNFGGSAFWAGKQ